MAIGFNCDGAPAPCQLKVNKCRSSFSAVNLKVCALSSERKQSERKTLAHAHIHTDPNEATLGSIENIYGASCWLNW